MPPKKSTSTIPATSANDETSILSVDGLVTEGSGKGKKKQSDVGVAEVTLGIEEYMMPRMMTVRLAKGVLPPQTLIHKDAAAALQYATSTFLNHIANAANEHTINTNRKNISPQDILEGIKDTEWGFLVPQLEEELAIYVRTVNDKRNDYRRRLKERDSGVGVAGSANKTNDPTGDGSLEDPTDGHKAKRVRLSDGATLDESQMEEDIPPEDDQDEEDEQDGEGAGEDEEQQDDDDDDDDDDDTEAYGSAAEELPDEDNDREVDERGEASDLASDSD